jgi:type III secretory pathway component EscV
MDDLVGPGVHLSSTWYTILVLVEQLISPLIRAIIRNMIRISVGVSILLLFITFYFLVNGKITIGL